MKVSDYVMEFLFNEGIEEIFMLPGGGNMHLSISLMKSKIQCIETHHELTAGMAGVAYARYKNALGVILVTSGPGGTHPLSACVEAYQSSTPCLFISGQVVYNQTIRSKNLPIRQVGVQETNIVPIVKSITKYADMVEDPQDIKFHLQKAIEAAKEGRPGPVWLDIPIDIQGSQIDPKSLREFVKKKDEEEIEIKQKDTDEIVGMIKNCNRPVILVGQGVRLSNAAEDIIHLAETFKVPVVTTYLGVDVINSGHECNLGCVGFRGTRHGNLTLQNADFLICIGSRLSMGTTGYNYGLFAKNAKVVVVDVDSIEHRKNTAKIDKFICSDAKKFITKLQHELEKIPGINFMEWLETCKVFKKKYPSFRPELKIKKEDGLNLYYVMDFISKVCGCEPILTDAGASFHVTPQAAFIKKHQRYIMAGSGPMGFGIPAAIGVSFAQKKGKVIAFTGDGSLQQTVAELQTIVHNQLPIKLFVLNNSGYFSMKPVIERGVDSSYFYNTINKNISFPNFKKIANAYGIKYIKIESIEDVETQIEKHLQSSDPIFFEVVTSNSLDIYTTTTHHQKDGSITTGGLECMYPFLSDQELKSNMIAELEENNDK